MLLLPLNFPEPPKPYRDQYFYENALTGPCEPIHLESHYEVAKLIAASEGFHYEELDLGSTFLAGGALIQSQNASDDSFYETKVHGECFPSSSAKASVNAQPYCGLFYEFTLNFFRRAVHHPSVQWDYARSHGDT
ncbi:hypothetical protein PanWU01x14_063130 [Parasponia andersonii]|uniref:Uncharacterized protein n=1 Tax=Parasponia andersonii TaxID=3476 RepID=A0A2P5DHR6_PARAD|nr:hypothetical protein PanWU01x14_063130 [Parasponia andersonii]